MQGTLMASPIAERLTVRGDAGIRVIRFGADGIEEVGHYVDANGNDFWGVEAHRLPGDPTETTYILGSDRDSGLWIFRYTGD